MIRKIYDEHVKNCDQFITECDRCHEAMTKAKKKMVVMHPLPRVFEIRYVRLDNLL